MDPALRSSRHHCTRRRHQHDTAARGDAEHAARAILSRLGAALPGGCEHFPRRRRRAARGARRRSARPRRQPVADATVETWQANAEGHYENQKPDGQPDFNLRGTFVTDDAGAFHYRTVKPAGYAVPDDGPVGRLLSSIGYPLRRPAHLQFIIRAPGFDTITTHVYDRNDPQVFEDALFAVREELLADFREQKGRNGTRQWGLEFSFVMARSRPGRRS